MFEIAPYATFSILFLIVITTAYLRSVILGYAEKHFPAIFTEFGLHEETDSDTSTLALYRYILSGAFKKTDDPIFIALCNRYIRWGQFFIISFVLALVDNC